MNYAYLALVVLFWQPIFWTGKAIYHLIKRDTWDASTYFSQVLGWFKQLFALLNPFGAHQ